MKIRWKSLFVLLALLVTVALLPSPGYAGVSVDVGLFYDDLAPHGDWIEMDDYGWVWTPRHVAADWRPYSRGHWVLTVDEGWLWVSDEDWGWATCHYGRWFFDQTHGWVWVPGREWAPAWVSWRTGGGYIGWAPLSPGFRWNAAVGFRVGDVNLDALIAPSRYMFVPEDHFLDARVFRRALPVSQNVVVLQSTRNVTRYAVVNHRPVDLGVDVGEVERGAHHAVPRVHVVEETSQRRVSRGSPGSTTVRVFRPEVHEAKGRTPRGVSVRTSVKPRPVAPRVPPLAPPRAVGAAGSGLGTHRSDGGNRLSESMPKEQARALRRDQAGGRATDVTRPTRESQDAARAAQRAQHAARAARAREADDARRRQGALALEQQKRQQAQAREEQKRAQRRVEAESRQREQAAAARAREADTARRQQEAQAREQQKQQQAQAREQQKRQQAQAREKQKHDEQARREEAQRRQRSEQAHQKQQEQQGRRAQEQARKKPAQGESEKS